MSAWKTSSESLKTRNQLPERGVKITISQEVFTEGQRWVQTCRPVWGGSPVSSSPGEDDPSLHEPRRSHFCRCCLCTGDTGQKQTLAGVKAPRSVTCSFIYFTSVSAGAALVPLPPPAAGSCGFQAAPASRRGTNKQALTGLGGNRRNDDMNGTKYKTKNEVLVMGNRHAQFHPFLQLLKQQRTQEI